MSLPKVQPMDEREALKSRKLPSMTLSKGDETSLTGPPPPVPKKVNAKERASFRFEVRGNAR